jgi:hypothetical protein
LKRTILDLLLSRSLPPVVDKLLDQNVRRLDAFLRRCEGIIEFTQDEQCILRFSVRRACKEEILPSGHRVAVGDPIGEIHLWNEHLPLMTPGGAEMVWGMQVRRRLQRSLSQLAAFVESDPRFDEIKVFCGETACAPHKSADQTRRMAAFFGFQIKENIRCGGMFGWLKRLGQAIYIWGMVRTFNRGAMKLDGLVKPTWLQFWMTRDTLLHKYKGAVRVPVSASTPELATR